MILFFRLKLILFLLFACVGVFSLHAQRTGSSVFDESILHRVDLQFDQSNYLNQLITNYENSDIGNVPYIMASVTIDGEEVDSVGARFKGASSYTGVANKQPFKIDFNEYVPEQRFDGLRKLNLNNSTGDLSLHRDPISYKVLNDMGVPAPRTSFSELYINGELWGVYQLVEQVDKEFLDQHYGSTKGNLFKNFGSSLLDDLGVLPEPYKEMISLKTNVDEDDWSGFIDFVQFLNTSNDVTFEEEIETYFNVDQFLRVLAVDVSVNNSDSYLFGGRNYYLYEDDASGVFNWIPWDYNLTFFGGPRECYMSVLAGALTNGTQTVQFGDYTASDASRLTYFWDFGDGNTSSERNPVHTYDSPGVFQVRLEVNGDGFCHDSDTIDVITSEDLSNCMSVDGELGSPIYDIPFVLVVEIDPECCDQWNSNCAFFYDLLGNSAIGGEEYLGFLIDQRENEGVLISRLLNIPEYYETYQAYMCELVGGALDSTRLLPYISTNELLLSPAVSRDPNFPGGLAAFQESMGPFGIKSILADREAALERQLDTVANCVDPQAIQFQEVVINEIAASMDSLGQVVDGVGQYDDWIELYNPGNTAVDLTGAFLTDTRSNLKKWRFPYGSIIEAQGYLIAWADKGLGQPGIHTSFRLKRTGEEVILSAAGGWVIDSVSFDEQTTNVTYARLPNGTGSFASATPTIGANNDGSSSTQQTIVSGKLSVFPNPAFTSLTIQFAELEGQAGFRVTSNSGHVFKQRTIQSQGQESLDVSGYAQGVYHLSVKHEGGVLTRRFVVLAP